LRFRLFLLAFGASYYFHLFIAKTPTLGPRLHSFLIAVLNLASASFFSPFALFFNLCHHCGWGKRQPIRDKKFNIIVCINWNFIFENFI
jgi:hypothetical protein